MMRRRTRRHLALAVGSALVVAGCGIPSGGQPDVVPPSAIPTALASPSPPPSPSPTSPPRQDAPQVHLLTPDGTVVASAREIGGASVRGRLGRLLDTLADGPTSDERDDGLATALPPGTLLTVVDLAEGTATIDVGGDADVPAGQASRRAVAQIVLTSTSLPEVTSVLLERDGEPLEAPLPSGELTSEPLTADDYAPLLVAPPS